MENVLSVRQAFSEMFREVASLTIVIIMMRSIKGVSNAKEVLGYWNQRVLL